MTRPALPSVWEITTSSGRVAYTVKTLERREVARGIGS